jgi:hypothetical protein
VRCFIAVFFSLILLAGCSSKKNNIINISFKGQNTSKSIFKVLDSIEIKNDSMKVLSIYKVMEYKDTTLLALDPLNTSILLLSKGGTIIKRIGRKGNGPGEFRSIEDFIVDENNNLYVLDYLGHKVGKFNSDLKFVKNYSLSFVHRNPEGIVLYNNQFIISAQNNLTNGSTKGNYSFLKYEDNSFLNVYDEKFNYETAFLHPEKKLLSTKGVLTRPWGQLAYAVVHGNLLFTITQEGFYKIKVFNAKHELLYIYNVKDSTFKNIDENSISNFRIINRRQANISEKEIGRIIGDHSVPYKVFSTKDFLIIEMRDPIPNYFPFYSKTYVLPTVYVDVFEFNGSKLEPLVSDYRFNNYYLVGVGKNNSIYLSNQTFGNTDRNSNIIIKHVKIVN